MSEDDYEQAPQVWIPRWPQNQNYTWLPHIPTERYPPVQEPPPLPTFLTEKYSVMEAKIADAETVKEVAVAALKKASESHTRVKEALATMRAWAITDVKRNEEKRLAKEVGEEEDKLEKVNRDIRTLKNELQPYIEVFDRHADMQKSYDISQALEAPSEDLTENQKKLLEEVDEKERIRILTEQATMHRLKLYPNRKKETVVEAPILPEKAPTSWADAVHRAKYRA